jgi:hypothetical protein
MKITEIVRRLTKTLIYRGLLSSTNPPRFSARLALLRNEENVDDEEEEEEE